MGSLTGKRLDIVIVITLNILGFIYAYLTRDLFIGTVLFSGSAIAIPSMIYLSLRKKKSWRKILLFTLIFGILYDGFVLELFAETTKLWSVTNPTIPLKIFDVIPIDSIIGQGVLSAMYIAIFYEHFFHSNKSKTVSPRLMFAIALGLYAFLGIFVIYLFNPQRLTNLPYPYLWVGSVAIIPPIVMAFLHPAIFKRMALMGIYFFFLFLITELFGTSYSWWVFNGDNYVGWIQIFNIKFPFEDLFFWMIFYPATLVSFYELFIDEEKCLPNVS